MNCEITGMEKGKTFGEILICDENQPKYQLKRDSLGSDPFYFLLQLGHYGNSFGSFADLERPSYRRGVALFIFFEAFSSSAASVRYFPTF